MHQSLQRQISKARTQQLKKSQSMEFTRPRGYYTNMGFGSANAMPPILPRYSDMVQERMNESMLQNRAASNESWNLAAGQDFQASGRSELFGFGADTAMSTLGSGSRAQSVPSILDNNSEMNWDLSDDNWMQLGLVDSSGF